MRNGLWVAAALEGRRMNDRRSTRKAHSRLDPLPQHPHTYVHRESTTTDAHAPSSHLAPSRG